MKNLSHSGYTTDRAVRNTLRCAGRVLGLPVSALATLPRAELRRLVRRARAAVEREWHAASLRVDAIVALQDLLEEVRR